MDTEKKLESLKLGFNISKNNEDEPIKEMVQKTNMALTHACNMNISKQY